MVPWVPEASLDEGEAVLWTINANRSQGGLARGGKLSLTTTHLRFVNNAMDQVTGASDWSAPLTDVVGVGVAPRSPRDFFGGGLRKRLYVAVRSGQTEVFVVNKVTEVVERIRAAR